MTRRRERFYLALARLYISGPMEPREAQRRIGQGRLAGLRLRGLARVEERDGVRGYVLTDRGVKRLTAWLGREE